MKQPRKHTALLFIALGIIALLLLVIDMATGDTYIPVSKVWAVLTGGECDEMTRNILLSIRFIRVIVAAGAIIQILQYLSSAEQLKMFTLWSMGSLGHITTTQLGIMTPMLCLGLLISIVCIKPLNLLLLGENYARTMGMNIKRSRTLIFISTALLTGTVTAFCGPVGFIGLAVPHVTRLLFNNADHRILVPATMLTGLISMLLCDIIAKKFLLPVNCITALLGVPVILWVIAKNLHGFK